MGNSLKFSCVTLAWSGRIQLTGPDAFSFLQGQWSQDLRLVSPGTAARGLFLDRKGRVEGDAWILQAGEDRFDVLSLSMDSASLRSRFEHFLIADEVDLIDAPLPGSLHILGSGAADVLAAAPGMVLPPRSTGTLTSSENPLLMRAPWLDDADAVWAWSPHPAGDEALSPLLASIPLLTPTEADSLRIACLQPRIPDDCGPSDLPGEAGLDPGLVCYTKGCFIGQEVLARLRAQGRLRRALHRVEARGTIPALPAPLYDGARRAGELRSACASPDGGWVGLALLTCAGLPPLLSLSPEGPADVRVTVPQAATN